MRLANWKCSRIITSAATKISETCVAVATGTKSTRETWIAAKGASVFQSRHMNIWLRKQINCLINEGNNIKANVWDLQVTMRNMKAELKRIKHTEEKITYLEKEIETARKNHEEENITTSSEEQYLKKLEKDKENLHLRIFMLSEKSSALIASKEINQQSYLQLYCNVNKLQRELQECKLICVEEDDVFTKMKHQIRELEEYIQEYQGKIQVLEDREKNLKKELSAIVKDKTQHRIKFQGRKNTERRKFCEEAALWW
ncbi:structural maintenance of chromosomes protein 6 isoform X7 [Anolis carolinensis]